MATAAPAPNSLAGLSRRQLLRRGLALGAALGSLGLLSACGQAPAAAPAVPAATSGAATTATGGPAPTGQPRRGGTLVGAFEADPVAIDPHASSNFSALQAYDHVYESLTAYDEQLNVVPALAERWDVSQDGLTYTFQLRPGVTFHNGQPLTADDVKYSLDRVLDPKTASPFKSWLGPLRETKVLDPTRVQLVLDAPFPGLLSGLAGNRASSIIPNGIADKENLKLKAIGTGPFKLAEFVPQDHATYQRNPDYWDKSLPYLDGMTFKVLSEENARLAALQAGQVQYALLSAQMADQIKTSNTVAVLKQPYAWVAVTYINVSRPPMDDPRVRKALRMATDTGEVVQKSVFGAGVPSGPIPTGYGDWYLLSDSLPYLKPDLEGARKLLADAGHPDGQGLKVQLKCSPQYPEFVSTATIMQEAFKKIGVETELLQLEWGTQNKDYQANDYQLMNSANTFRPDPDGYIYSYFHSKGNLNAGGYKNDALDQMIDKARSISDKAERKNLYADIQKTLLEDSPNFWWYAKFNFEGISTKLQGYAQSFTGRQLFLKKSWLLS
jgi:peptide/nickel transport system substrate-binding protein